ncbi:hypothetical protein COCNU_12G003380 [Cocos nucifera]|uniref:AT hook motif-containing protein n=1 Tax=Cocos nucifera TaxID=13894 RepID=A0A8K0IRU6_COCNU|nr:hypothetical protein COCNU_12G003380 [Cocos nucifera]
MAQQNQEIIPIDPASFPLRRKRGRPRKNDGPGNEQHRRSRQSQANATQAITTQAPSTHANPIASSSCGPHGLVGQKVSGILEGTFDAGYHLTVRAGETGPVFSGLVFDPRRAVPLTEENDIAPFLPMSRSNEILHPVPQAPPQAPVSTPILPVSKMVTGAPPLQIRERATPSPPVNHLLESSRLLQTAPSTKEVVQNNANRLPQDVRPALQTDLKNILMDTLFRKKANNEHPKSEAAAPQQALPRSMQTGPSSGPSHVMNETIPATIEASSGDKTEKLVEVTRGDESSNQTEGSSSNISRIEQSDKTLTGSETSDGKPNYTGQALQSDKTLMDSEKGGGNSDIAHQALLSDKNLMGNKIGGEMDSAGEVPQLGTQVSEERQQPEELQDKTDQ